MTWVPMVFWILFETKKEDLGQWNLFLYHLVICNIAMEAMAHRKFDGLPNLKMVIFHGYVK